MKTCKVNYESDFKLTVRPKDIQDITAAPFELVFYTKKAVRTYIAKYDGKEYTHCYPSPDGGVVVVFDNHKLGIGQMWFDVHVPLTDKDFADGVCNYRSTEYSGIVIDKGHTDDLGEFEVTLFPFYQRGEDGKSAYDLWLEEGNEGTAADFLASIKGDKGDKMTYEDLTEEDKEDLASHFKMDVVNNLEDGGEDKALSAEMGKFLNEKIANIVAGNTTEPIKFKGYVNVDNKNGIDAMFGLLSEGEACLVAPSVNTGNGDSYKAWIASAINDTEITLGSDLFKTSHNISAANIALGRLEVKTYLKLDENQPYCQCPDMILLCKVRVRAKDFIEFVGGISETIANLIPSSMMLTACIGKVLRWSGGDWVADNKIAIDKNILSHKYEWGFNINDALETGIIAYTNTNDPMGNGDWCTVYVFGSTDGDHAGNRTIQQIAYGRTGASTNRVWTRLIFGRVSSDTLPWIEISNESLYKTKYGYGNLADTCLKTGVNNYFSDRIGGITANWTLFVTCSSDGDPNYYHLLQTAVCRDDDNLGRIFQRMGWYKGNGEDLHFTVWREIGADLNNYVTTGNLDAAFRSLQGQIPTKTSQLTNDSGYATGDEVATAIANAITNTLNTEV